MQIQYVMLINEKHIKENSVFLFDFLFSAVYGKENIFLCRLKKVGYLTVSRTYIAIYMAI